MEIIKQPTKFIVNRTLADDGAAYPHHIWRDPSIKEVEVVFTDVDGQPSVRYTRLTDVPIVRNKVHPVTYKYSMTPVHQWAITYGDSKRIELIDIDVYAKPVTEDEVA